MPPVISIREFITLVFERLDLDWNQYVEIDPRYFRPAEVDHLEGDPSKIQRLMGWEAHTTVQDLVAMMVASDLVMAERERVLKAAGHVVLNQGGYR
jgi:GDPmannose 4,6-dehydratase